MSFIIASIIQSGYNPNVFNRLFYNSLYSAACIGCSENIATLVFHGADPNPEVSPDPEVNRENIKTSILACVIFERNRFAPTPLDTFRLPTVKYADFVNDNLLVNETEVARAANGICALIRNHAFYATEEPEEAGKYLSLISSDTQYRTIVSHSIRESISKSLIQFPLKRINPYLSFCMINNHRIYSNVSWPIMEKTLEAFLKHTKDFENAQKEAEHIRETFLEPYVKAIPRVVRLLIAGYWIPGSPLTPQFT